MRGRTLGIVGYGNIGSQLSVLAEAFGMRVIYLRPHHQAAARQCPALLLARRAAAETDIVTLHVPETPETIGMIGPAEIAA